MNLSAHTTSQLLAAYNAISGQNIARFADRKTAERRVSALFETNRGAIEQLLAPASAPVAEPTKTVEAPAVVAEDEALDVPAFLKKGRAANIAAIAEVLPEPVKAPKAVKPAKARKPRAEKAEAPAKRARIEEEAVIVTVIANPKREGSRAHARFALYREGQTVKEFMDACVAAGFPAAEAKTDISWDRRHGFIKVEG